MTGAELAREVRALRPALPILLATGHAELSAGLDLDLLPRRLRRLARSFAHTVFGVSAQVVHTMHVMGTQPAPECCGDERSERAAERGPHDAGRVMRDGS